MNSSMTFTFAYPWRAVLFILLPIFIALFWWLHNHRREILTHFAQKNVLSVILMPRSTKNYILQALCWCAAWTLGVLAIMWPQGNGEYVGESVLAAQSAVAHRKAHEVIFLLDLSASMSVVDTSENMSRLDYAKELIQEIVNRLQGETVSLYTFTSTTTMLVPPTLDTVYLRLKASHVFLNEGNATGTDFLQALHYIQQRYLTSYTPQTIAKTLIIISDGGDNALEDTSDPSAREQRENGIINELKDASTYNLEVYSIGIGSTAGGEIPNLTYEGHSVTSAYDDRLMKAISQNGFYVPSEGTPATVLADQIVNHMNKHPIPLQKITHPHPIEGGVEIIYKPYFQYPLFFAILFVACALLIPNRSRNTQI